MASRRFPRSPTRLGRETGRGPMGSAWTSGNPDNSRIPIRTPLPAGIRDFAASEIESSAAIRDRLNWSRDLFDKALADIREELMEQWIGGDYLRTEENRDQLKARLFEAWRQAGVVGLPGGGGVLRDVVSGQPSEIEIPSHSVVAGRPDRGVAVAHRLVRHAVVDHRVERHLMRDADLAAIPRHQGYRSCQSAAGAAADDDEPIVAHAELRGVLFQPE